jgi:hypothetical protein
MVGEGEAQAALRGGDEPEEFPGQNSIVGRSIEEDYQQMMMDPRQAAVWSAKDHDANFVDLAGPSELPAPKEEEEEDDWSFGTSSDEAATTATTSTSAPSTRATSFF